LSKTLAGCGGYIAGPDMLIDFLKHAAGGFVYSVAMPPAITAAALAALELLHKEPERVQRLRANAAAFMEAARRAGLDTGASIGASVVPVMTGSSVRAGALSQRLFDRGVNVQPIIYPAIPERLARLRFFLSSEHTLEQIEKVVPIIASEFEAAAATSLKTMARSGSIG
jgi:7-keto-8-aminopelargonate synthetase-like enzyme